MDYMKNKLWFSMNVATVEFFMPYRHLILWVCVVMRLGTLFVGIVHSLCAQPFIYLIIR